MSRLTDLQAELLRVNQWGPEAAKIRDEIIAEAARDEIARLDSEREIVAPGLAVARPVAPVEIPEIPADMITLKRLSADQVRQAMAGAARAGIPHEVVMSALVGLEAALDNGTRRTFPADAAGQEERKAYHAAQMQQYIGIYGETDTTGEPHNPSAPAPRPGAVTRHANASAFWNATGLTQFVNDNGLGNDTGIWDAGHRAWTSQS
jgi:hypothetical protein